MPYITNLMRGGNICLKRAARSFFNQNWETYLLSTPCQNTLHIQINRPEKRNSMNTAFWRETKEIFTSVRKEKSVRAIILSGVGKVFSSGIDLMDASGLLSKNSQNDNARTALKIRDFIVELQDAITSLEKCNKPVIAVIHGACVGGGLDLICAADIRYCTRDAWFQAKELELGIAPDIGTIQRLPRIIGNESMARELIYTARRFDAAQAYQFGLVSRLSDTLELALEEAFKTGERIAALSPVAVQTTKSSLLFSRDHSVQEGLSHLADLNQVMLQSEDVPMSVQAVISKKKPTFSDA